VDRACNCNKTSSIDEKCVFEKCVVVVCGAPKKTMSNESIQEEKCVELADTG